MVDGARQDGGGARRAPGGMRETKPVSFRPVAYRHLGARKNLWADYVTGRGVLDNGQVVPPKIGARRKNPNLTDMLDTAAAVGVDRIMFTGKVPTVTPGRRHWLLVQTPGWIAAGHHTGSPATGRFEHRQTGKKMLVQFAAGWFGDTALTPDQARLAFQATQNVIGAFFRDAKLMDTPTATGATFPTIQTRARKVYFRTHQAGRRQRNPKIPMDFRICQVTEAPPTVTTAPP